MADTEQLIRERAYLLWEQEGRPEGRDREHWEQACSLLSTTDSGTAASLLPLLAAEANGHAISALPPTDPRDGSASSSDDASRSRKKKNGAARNQKKPPKAKRALNGSLQRR